MLRLVMLVAALGGCDVVFGIDGSSHADAAVGDIRGADAPDAATLANHDEDNDTIDDAIDLCPNVTSPAPAGDSGDADGDGVGDLCDPAPDVPDQRRVYFTSLQSFSDWTTLSGTWTQAADAVVVTPAGGNQLARHGGTLVPRPVVYAVVEAPTPYLQPPDYGIVLAADTSGSALAFPPGLGCYISASAGTLVIYDTRAQSPLVSSMPIDAVLPVRLIVESGSNGAPDCLAIDAQGQVTAIQSTNSNPMPEGIVELYTSYGGATFESVFVISGS